MIEHSLSGSAGDTRERLVDAAEQVIRAKGLARTTTKEIARAAGCAEGTLYLHFADKLDLFRAVAERLLPPFISLVSRLPGKAGTSTVAANLTELAEGALLLYRDFSSITSAIFADPELLERHRALLQARGEGPHRAYAPIIAYLEAEQAVGRVADTADPAATAVLLLGACQQYVFVEEMVGADISPLRDRPSVAGALVAALLAGIAPGGPSDPADTQPSDADHTERHA